MKVIFRQVLTFLEIKIDLIGINSFKKKFYIC